MSGPRSLPPGARWITLPSGERRIELVADIGSDPKTGRRRQSRRRFRTVEQARNAYAEIRTAVRSGAHVARSRETLSEAAATWLAGKRNLKPSTKAGYEHALEPLLAAYGAQPVQRLTKAQLDELVSALTAGSLPRADGRPRRPWSGRTVKITLFVLGQILDDLIAQGRLTRNVADLVERPRHQAARSDTWTVAEVRRVLAAARGDRMEVAWLLALQGLRRGEVAGLRWENVNLETGTISITLTRISVNGRVVETDPKSLSGRRALPLTAQLTRAFKEARRRQAAERLALGAAYVDSGFVLVDEAGEAMHPDTLTTKFEALIRTAGVTRIRLHDARHTCGTLMHLAGEPAAAIAAWLGHSSAAFTMRTYVHSQDDALRSLAGTLDRVFESPDVTSA